MAATQAEVVIRSGDQVIRRHLIGLGAHVIGRDPACQIQVDLDKVSGRHAQLTVNPFHVLLEDLGSSNGTFVDGQRITQTVTLQPKQEVRIGGAILQIEPIDMSTTVAQRPAPTAKPRVVDDTPETLLPKEGHYEVTGIHAQGGMGLVLRARDLNIRRSIAMKVISPEKRASQRDWLRFIEEAQVTGQLEHPNIVPVHDLGVNAQGQVFYTMKFVEGVTLHEVLAKIAENDKEVIARYPLAHLLTIFQKVCDAVAFAHSRGIVHRDLKPANIMIGEYGEVQVLDWGLAKVLTADQPGAEKTINSPPPSNLPDIQSPGLTLDGTVMGTPQFMAPEQAEGQIGLIDARTDVYALGAILYNILTLQPPFVGEVATDVLARVRAGDITPPITWNTASQVTGPGLLHLPSGHVPESLSAVAMKALRKAQANRYQTVQELQRDLEAYQGGFATSAEQAGMFKLLWLLIRRHKVEFALSAGAALALVVVAVTAFARITAEKNRATATLAELRDTAPTHYAQALALVQQHRFDEALQKISYAVQLEPKNADYYYLRGNILQSLLRLGEAEQAYAAGLQCDAHHQLAKVNQQLCGKLLEQDRNLKEPSIASLEQLHTAMLEQRRHPEAVAMLDRLGDQQDRYLATWKAVIGDSPLAKGLRLEQNELAISIKDDGKFGITSLQPLRGVPLRRLLIDNGRSLSQLNPLRGMPLTRLELPGCTSLHDLRPLQGMRLERLRVSYGSVNDLSPLEGMPLRSLDAQATGVSDLSPLRGMPLDLLNVGRTGVRDLTPLQGAPLTLLHIWATPVTDLTPLRGMPLKELRLDGCQKLVDVSPLCDCRELERLTLPPNAANLECLRSLPKLKFIFYEWDNENRQPSQTAAQFWKAYDAKKQAQP